MLKARKKRKKVRIKTKKIVKGRKYFSTFTLTLSILGFAFALISIYALLQSYALPGLPAPAISPSVTLEIANSFMKDNSIIVNLNAPTIFVRGQVVLSLPSTIFPDQNAITGTGFFSNLNKYETIYDADDKTLTIRYLDLMPNDYQGTLRIPFSAVAPGEYEIQIVRATAFQDKAGNIILLPEPIVKKFILSK